MLVSGNRVERDVPWLCLESSDALRFMRQAEQEGTPCMCKASYEGKAAIVVTAAHAESVTIAVETQQRDDYQVEPTRGNQP